MIRYKYSSYLVKLQLYVLICAVDYLLYRQSPRLHAIQDLQSALPVTSKQ
jgi:hypothetical protein